MLRVLHIEDLYFLLPEDFEGGLADALRALANYHDDVAGKPIQDIRPTTSERDEIPHGELREQTFHAFWDTIHGETGRRVVGCASVSEYDPESNEMEHLDLNTGEPDS